MHSQIMPPKGHHAIPDFLVKTTVGCSLIVVLLVVPFTINNFIQGRILMGVATTLVAAACITNVVLGLGGRYSLAINTYLVSPAAAFTITYVILAMGNSGSYWPFLLVIAYYYTLPERRAQLVNAITVAIIVPCAWQVLDEPSALRFSAVIVGTSLFAYFSMRQIYKLNILLKDLATKDPLTGLYNRTLLDDHLNQAIAQYHRTQVPMSLLVLDIDHFKSINDTFGHDVGDKVLVKLAQLLRRHTRATDLVFRMGGEEFLVLAHNADIDRAAQIAEKLRSEVAAADMLPDHSSITLSAGVVGLEPDMSAGIWRKVADQRLYKAKHAGRNRVEA